MALSTRSKIVTEPLAERFDGADHLTRFHRSGGTSDLMGGGGGLRNGHSRQCLANRRPRGSYGLREATHRFAAFIDDFCHPTVDDATEAEGGEPREVALRVIRFGEDRGRMKSAA